MKKSLALAIYLFNIQRKNLNHMLFMFLIPLALYVFNCYKYEPSLQMLISFVAIAPIQMLLYQFGGTFVSHKQSGSLIKYQLMGFKPIQVMVGIVMSTFIFEIIYVLGILIVTVYLTHSLFFVDNLMQIFTAFILLNAFEFSLVIMLTSFSKSYEQYNTFSTVAFYSQLMILITMGSKVPFMAIIGVMCICLITGLKFFKWHTL